MNTTGWLVIFDCDGVLVDTEAVANKRLAQYISDAGFPISYEQSRARFVGMSMKTIRDRLLAQDDVDLGADFPQRWQAAIPEIFSADIEPIDGIADTLAAIGDHGHQLCVASSGNIEKMHLTLGSAGLLDQLADVLFSSTMVENGKPAPDLFLHAAATMRISPDRCIVIEDSPFGAQAAKAAGMTCFGYIGDPLTDADGLEAQGAHLFDRMDALPALIKSHIEN